LKEKKLTNTIVIPSLTGNPETLIQTGSPIKLGMTGEDRIKD